MAFSQMFTRMANAVSQWTGKPATFIAACAIIIIWAVSGPVFNYSDTWQLVINTGTTIVTFLMVFLIQNTQNRDNAALHSKLDELILVGAAQNKFIGIESLPEEEISKLREGCRKEAMDTDENDGAKAASKPRAPAKRRRASPRTALAAAKVAASARVAESKTRNSRKSAAKH